MKALMAAAELRTLGISHFDIWTLSDSGRMSYFKEIIASYRPLLERLEESRHLKDGIQRTLGFLKLEFPPGLTQNTPFGDYGKINLHSPRCKKSVECRCTYDSAIVDYERFNSELREVVAAELGISDK